MKKLLFAIVFFLFGFNLFAQNPISINGDYSKGTITINNVTFTKASTLQDYEKVLGKAERVEKVGGKDKFMVYDKLGISLILKFNTNIVEEVSVAYEYDGDRKVAKEAFQGTLAIGGTTINKETNSDEIAKLSTLKLLKVMDGFYMGKGKTMHLVIYYPTKTLGQLAFSFGELK